MFNSKWAIGVAIVAVGIMGLSVNAQVRVDEATPEYQRVAGVSGSIKCVGSDSMNNMMTLWAEGFRRVYPNVQIEIEGKGSTTAPPALVEGTAAFGMMSRAMRGQEIDAFEQRHGYRPTQLRTSIDMLAVYVHKDNPIARTGLTLQQIDAIFSKSRRGGHSEDIRTWGQLGLTGEWADKPISIYGRNSASGTYGFFREVALFRGDYKDEVKAQPGSASVVQGVASDRFAIGYSGIGYRTADVVLVPIARNPDADFVEATPENAYSGEYPLARFLYVYVNYRPGSELDPLRREFIRYMFSKQGQEDVVRDGYYPVPSRLGDVELRKVGITR
ncbi:MAG: PstS family phosphate ABC transporter substrate-binding protein [Phycisphaeraceae bacterium]|nr:PstS family phosphate ABC transporter substrate-binding protein [Phycisphaeraceae bacterium]